MPNTSEGINYIIFTIDKLSPIKHRLEKLLSEEELDMVTKRKNSQLPTMIKTLVELDQEIIIAQIPMMITFEVVEKTYWDIILGLNWLEEVKPYKIEPTHITITYDKKKIIIHRIIWKYTY